MRSPFSVILAGVLCLSLFTGQRGVSEQKSIGTYQPTVEAAVIVCKGYVDDNLYKSVRYRTQVALDAGAEYLVYEIATYGGLLEAADDITKYLILDVNKKAHTVAYITGEAISAAAMISVSCKDIIMRENTTIGYCTPTAIYGKLEGVEREMAESFTRAQFMRAAEVNGYPPALLKAMVTMGTKIYEVKNLQTGQYEFLDEERLAEDPNRYDLADKELIVKDNEILTLTASKAFEYGIARAVVKDRAEALAFLAQRDGVTFGDIAIYEQAETESHVESWMNVLLFLAFGVSLTIYLIRKWKRARRPRQEEERPIEVGHPEMNTQLQKAGIIRGFLSFEKMVTPVLIRFFFIVILAVCLFLPATKLVDLLNDPNVDVSAWQVIRLFLPYLAVIVVGRVILEAWIVIYRMHETLIDIRKILRGRAENH